MVLIVINHKCLLASYVIAYALLKYFNRLRDLKILIIESRSNFNRPWCGINTINDFRLKNREFFHHLLFQDLIVSDPYILALKSVNQTHHLPDLYNMDSPIYGQHQGLNVILNDKNHLNSIIGLIYHPDLLISRLKMQLFASNKVNFISSISIPASLKQLGEKSIVLNFDMVPTMNIDLVTHSNLVFTNLATPKHLLWLPRFSSSTNLYLQYGEFHDHTAISIGSNDKYSHINGELDLTFGLKLADLAISSLQEMANQGKLTSQSYL